MPCEGYREALSEAAAGGEREVSLKLRAHLRACRECSAAFQDEQKLFAAIGGGVQKIANAEVPVSLLPRLRASLEREVAPRRSFLRHFVLAGATICAAVAIVAMKEWRRVEVVPRVVSVANRATPAEKPSGEVAARDVKPDVRPAPRQSKHDYISARAAEPQVMVLLPAGEKQAVDKLLGELRSGVVKPGDVIVEKAEAPSPDLQVAPLSITPIEVKPLATIVEDAAPASEKTKS